MRLAFTEAVGEICLIMFAGIKFVIMYRGGGGIDECLFGDINDFNVDHQSFEERELEVVLLLY